MEKKKIWDPRFDELAEYNTLKAKGLLFSKEKKERMKRLQEEYDEFMMRVYG